MFLFCCLSRSAAAVEAGLTVKLLRSPCSLLLATLLLLLFLSPALASWKFAITPDPSSGTVTAALAGW
jgi:hypothetical protein